MKLIINDRIRQRAVEFFNNFTLDLKYDSIASSFAFNMRYNESNQEHRELAEIGHYHIARIEHNDQVLMTGYILSESFKATSKDQLLPISGYSLSGVLEDCNIPPSLYPLQFDKLSLREITNKLLSPFAFSFSIDNSVSSRMNKVYDTITAKPTQTIKQFLCELASERNIILTHDESGNLRFTQVQTNIKPIINFDSEQQGVPFESMTLKFNGQGMHSHITVMKQANSSGGNAGEVTITNPYVPYVYRPKVILQNSGDDNDTNEVARMALSVELKGIVLTIVTDRWEIDGKVIMPNNIITVKNPKLSMYKKTKWFIESVSLNGDSERTTATLTCYLPEVYNNQPPKYIFNTH